ncbi:MAG: DNA repair protein RecO [Thermodesulfobacteriota bacterium]
MSNFSTPAIMLRRTDFGDYDLILTFLSLSRGKISVIAKSAKKSTKRFAGVLELFSAVEIVCREPRSRGLPVLEEATLRQPFAAIRADIYKTAYASYWAELVQGWTEESEKQVPLYRLLEYALGQLDRGKVSEAALSILFQIRFMRLCGLSPNLVNCSNCRVEIEQTRLNDFAVDLPKGGILCDRCAAGAPRRLFLSKGTIKQLVWAEGGNIARAGRIRFTPQALKESQLFLEDFVPFHLGKKPRSLAFLQKLRG